MSQSCTIHLPYPPSVNHYWRNVRGRTLISEQGRAYRTHAAWSVRQVRAPAFGEARLAVELTAYMPDRRRRDLDNVGKAVLDALQHAGIYADDSQIDDLRIVRGELRPPAGAMTVTLRTI
jgi:crossover junction endodeoxyribonuclease RusA